MAAMATGFNSDQQPDENCQVQEMNVTAYKSVFHRAKKTSRKLLFFFFATFDVFEVNLRFKTVFILPSRDSAHINVGFFSRRAEKQKYLHNKKSK